LFYSYCVFTICLPVRLVDEYCKGFITYITLFRLTGQQSHNTQHNTVILNQTLKKEKEDTVNEEHTRRA